MPRHTIGSRTSNNLNLATGRSEPDHLGLLTAVPQFSTSAAAQGLGLSVIRTSNGYSGSQVMQGICHKLPRVEVSDRYRTIHVVPGRVVDADIRHLGREDDLSFAEAISKTCTLKSVFCDSLRIAGRDMSSKYKSDQGGKYWSRLSEFRIANWQIG